MILKEHQSDELGLSDLLNYAHLVDDGVIINKDGAFLTTFKFRGPDINSADTNELDALTANFNRVASLLEDGWMLHFDEVRIPSLTYSKEGFFKSNIASLIDEERRRWYEAEGAHYENLQFITFIWKLPLPMVKTARSWFIDGIDRTQDRQSLAQLLTIFLNTVERCVGLLDTQLILEKLSSDDLLTYLNLCISGKISPVTLPFSQVFIDTILGRHRVLGGYIPKIGDNYLIALSIIGYLGDETKPGLLETMSTYPLIYRWSNRFIVLSESSAEREIKRYQKNWNNKVKGIFGILKEAAFGKPAEKINIDALQMSQETNTALTINSNHSSRFGYWTSTLILINENLEVLMQAAKELAKYIEQAGFACVKEDVNAMDAWLGSIPGHGSCNVRRQFLNAINLAHVLPLHSIWTGAPFSSKVSLLPPNSPPVFYAATTGKTPFRFHLDVADVGHQILLGPTGSGKSTFLGFLIAQFLRYQNAQIFVFDKDYSHKALTIALNGHHYDIGNADELAFCPLADLANETKKMRAAQFIENLVWLQNIKITPDIRQAVYQAIESLADESHQSSRNITVLQSEVQHEEVRAALQYYTIDGAIKLLDATHDSLQTGYLQTFEMNWLLAQKPEIFLPILMYIFDQIESLLEESMGKTPTLIVLEEAWLYITHEIFAKKLRDWLKTLRKKNARVIFATQSLADLYDPSTKTLSNTTAVIMESCPTKVYLANPKMEAETSELYRKMGLNDRQIELISQVAVPKQHYYVVTPQGNRLIELGFDDDALALAFIGLSKESANQLIASYQQYGKAWAYYWLQQNGHSFWAEYWRGNYGNQ
jgi:type IV secretion system protein TrbE